MLFHQSITGEAGGWQQEWKLSINTSNLLARKAGVFCCFIHTCKEQPVPLFPSAAVRKSNLYFLTEHIPSLCLHSYGLSPFHFINTGMNYEPPEEVSYLMPYLRSLQDYDLFSKIILMLFTKIITHIACGWILPEPFTSSIINLCFSFAFNMAYVLFFYTLVKQLDSW